MSEIIGKEWMDEVDKRMNTKCKICGKVLNPHDIAYLGGVCSLTCNKIDNQNKKDKGLNNNSSGLNSKPSEVLRLALHKHINKICNELGSEWDDIQDAIEKACNKYPDLRDNIFKDYVWCPEQFNSHIDTKR